MLARVVGRTRQAQLIDDVVVATTIKPEDDTISVECTKLGVRVYRGHPYDVLDRFHSAAESFQPEAIVRITADCPLIDSDVIDGVIAKFLEQECDYCSNTIELSFPRGLDVEIFTRDALHRAWTESREGYERAHVTAYMYRHPEIFNLSNVHSGQNLSSHRWTVDEQEDLEFVRQIYARFPGCDYFGWKDVLKLLTIEPNLAEINKYIRQKAIEEG